MKLSIKTTNRTLIFLFFGSNFLFAICMLITMSERIRVIITFSDILLSIIFITTYLLINRKYKNDYNNLIESFRETMKGESSYIFKSSIHFFQENKEMETLFKKSYIKNNLLKKDFEDLLQVFEKFIPKEIYREVWFRWYEKIVLGGCRKKHLNVMFLDIVWFTTISEKMTPERALLLLNIYFDGIGELVYQHGGYIDKFLGDGIMIIFEQETSDDTLSCAIEIQEFIKRLKISSFGERMSIGIGINAWEVIMGTIGTKSRMDATIIGDTVNTASRLEGLTRKYDKKIILSQSVVDRIENPKKFSLDEIDTIVLKGKVQSTRIFSLNSSFDKDV